MGSIRLSKEKEHAIFDWVAFELRAVISEQNIIWEKDNSDRPLPPYVSLNIIAGPVRLGGEAELRHESGDNFSANWMKTITLSVKSYGNNDLNLLERLQNSLGKPTVLARLRAVGLAIVSEGPIQDISTRLQTGYEERSNMDVIMAFASSVEDKVGYINDVELTGGVEGGYSPTQTIEGP